MPAWKLWAIPTMAQDVYKRQVLYPGRSSGSFEGAKAYSLELASGGYAEGNKDQRENLACYR